jgi:hypothetical protein
MDLEDLLECGRSMERPPAGKIANNDLFSQVVPTKGSQLLNAINMVKWYFKLGLATMFTMGEGPIYGWTGGLARGHCTPYSP